MTSELLPPLPAAATCRRCLLCCPSLPSCVANYRVRDYAVGTMPDPLHFRPCFALRLCFACRSGGCGGGGRGRGKRLLNRGMGLGRGQNNGNYIGRRDEGGASGSGGAGGSGDAQGGAAQEDDHAAEAALGFALHTDGPDRLGWLMNLHQSIKIDKETGHTLSVVNGYFMCQVGVSVGRLFDGGATRLPVHASVL